MFIQKSIQPNAPDFHDPSFLTSFLSAYLFLHAFI